MASALISAGVYLYRLTTAVMLKDLGQISQGSLAANAEWCAMDDRLRALQTGASNWGVLPGVVSITPT